VRNSNPYHDWNCCDFPQSPHLIVRIVRKGRSRPLPFISIPIHYSVIITSFDVLESGLRHIIAGFHTVLMSRSVKPTIHLNLVNAEV
jgi:hypothetical protein